MNTQEHFLVANTLLIIDKVIRDCTGFASDAPWAFKRTEFSPAEKRAIATSLKERLALEKHCMAEYPGYHGTKRLEQLLSLLLTCFEEDPAETSGEK